MAMRNASFDVIIGIDSSSDISYRLSSDPITLNRRCEPRRPLRTRNCSRWRARATKCLTTSLATSLVPSQRDNIAAIEFFDRSGNPRACFAGVLALRLRCTPTNCSARTRANISLSPQLAIVASSGHPRATVTTELPPSASPAPSCFRSDRRRNPPPLPVVCTPVLSLSFKWMGTQSPCRTNTACPGLARK